MRSIKAVWTKDCHRDSMLGEILQLTMNNFGFLPLRLLLSKSFQQIFKEYVHFF
jgi:hypothetical protein